MNEKEILELVNELFENEEVSFMYKNYFINIFENSNGEYEGNIYNSKEDYENDKECEDGGICESVISVVAIYFFKEIADELIKNGEETC